MRLTIPPSFPIIPALAVQGGPDLRSETFIVDCKCGRVGYNLNGASHRLGPMPDIPATITWLSLEKHRKVNKKRWDNGQALAMSKNKASQYNPHLYFTDEEVKALETLCLSTGTVIYENADFRSCYLRIPGVEVGVCSGEITEYVYAEMYN